MDLLIESATLLDLETGELHGGSSVRVQGDRIVETAPGRTLAANDEIVGLTPRIACSSRASSTHTYMRRSPP
jgi:hypothetical protein